MMTGMIVGKIPGLIVGVVLLILCFAFLAVASSGAHGIFVLRFTAMPPAAKWQRAFIPTHSPISGRTI